MFQTVENGRFLTLYGTDVPQYRARTRLGQIFQKAVGFVKRPEVIVPLALFFGIASQGDFSKLDLLKGSMLIGIMTASADLMAKGASMMNGNKELHIDKEVHKSVTKAEEKDLAKRLAMGYGAFGLLVLTTTSADVYYGMNNTLEIFQQSKPINDILTKFVLSSVFILNSYRFMNVVTQRWNLVDEPPEQKDKPPASPGRRADLAAHLVPVPVRN